MPSSLTLSQITHFAHWWRVGLMAWLPESWQVSSRQKAFIRCQFDAEQVLFEQVSKQGKPNDRHRIDLAELNQKQVLPVWLTASSVELTLPTDKVLVTTLMLPAQARENLPDIVSFEIDRQTPFSVDQVYWDYVIDSTLSSADSLAVKLMVVPKQVIVKQQAGLSQLGLSISAVLLPVNDELHRIALMNNAAQSDRSAWLNSGLVALSLVLLALLLYQPVMEYEAAIAEIEPKLAEVKQEAMAVRALQKNNQLLQEQLQFVQQKDADYLLRIQLLAKLSALLPEHTWLERSEIKQNKLTLRGESSQASDLIGLLTTSGLLDSVRFSAPTTHSPQSGKDRFQIEAVIVPTEVDDV